MAGDCTARPLVVTVGGVLGRVLVFGGSGEGWNVSGFKSQVFTLFINLDVASPPSCPPDPGPGSGRAVGIELMRTVEKHCGAYLAWCVSKLQHTATIVPECRMIHSDSVTLSLTHTGGQSTNQQLQRSYRS